MERVSVDLAGPATIAGFGDMTLRLAVFDLDGTLSPLPQLRSHTFFIPLRARPSSSDTSPIQVGFSDEAPQRARASSALLSGPLLGSGTEESTTELRLYLAGQVEPTSSSRLILPSPKSILAFTPRTSASTSLHPDYATP